MNNVLSTRRSILQGWFAATATGFGLSMLPPFGVGHAQLLQATPACGADDEPTRSLTEGPFFSPGTPAKKNFRTDAQGEPLTLAGFVVDRDCRPIAGAMVDVWHADAQGRYDNQGFKLRGHQFTDAMGRYVFETIMPAQYSRRTRHIHVKVRPPGGRLLTTQLYFPGEAGNGRDFLFDERLLMRVEDASDGKIGRFDFVMN